MISHWAYIIIGNNNSGKTSFQRHLVDVMCDKQYSHLPSNEAHEIVLKTHSAYKRNLFVMGRSFQEKKDEWGPTVEDYFYNVFDAKLDKHPADIAVLSSHFDFDEINQMVTHLKGFYPYNVAVLVFSNSAYPDLPRILSEINWDERVWIYNDYSTSEDVIQRQLRKAALEFCLYLNNKGA